ncbi:unnamed protein product, partial [Prorocentrum cordatum]
ASGHSSDRPAKQLVDDDTQKEWFAPKGAKEAWVQIDLGELCMISGARLHWWALQARSWRMEVAGPDRVFRAAAERRSLEAAAENELNVQEEVPGWPGPTQHVRLTI